MFSAKLPFKENLNYIKQYPELFVEFAKKHGCIDKSSRLILQKSLNLLGGTSLDWYEYASTIDNLKISRKRSVRGIRKKTIVAPEKNANHCESVYVCYVNMKSI